MCVTELTRHFCSSVYGCLQTHWRTCLLLLDEDILVCVLTSGKDRGRATT